MEIIETSKAKSGLKIEGAGEEAEEEERNKQTKQKIQEKKRKDDSEVLETGNFEALYIRKLLYRHLTLSPSLPFSVLEYIYSIPLSMLKQVKKNKNKKKKKRMYPIALRKVYTT